jgi:hypothetical protein
LSHRSRARTSSTTSRFFELKEIDEGVLEPVYIRDLALVEIAKRLKEAEDADQLA